MDASKVVAIDYTATSTQSFTYGGNRGPRCAGFPPFTSAHPLDDGADTSSGLHSIGAQLIRTHDTDALDWNLAYPHPSFDANTSDPASYNFSAGDRYMRRILGGGFGPYLRLGAGYFIAGGGVPRAGLPYNRTALVDVLLHIVMHYNDGWGGGPFRNRSVRYVEIWNEPDSSCQWSTAAGCGKFWNRSAADFYDLFDATARALKRHDPSLLVGGPGCALPYAPWARPAPNPFSFGLIDEVAKRRTPLDFFSWHFYTDQAGLMTTIAAAVRAKLEGAGLSGVEQHVSEWNICALCKEQDTAEGAAATAHILMRMMAAKVGAATFYPTCAGGEGQTGTGWGLFDQETRPGLALWRKQTHAHAAFGEALGSAPASTRQPRPLLLVAARPAEEGFGGMATKAAADAGSLRVLLASQRSNYSAVKVVIANIATHGSTTWRWTVSVINATSSNATLASGEAVVPQGGLLEVRFSLPPPAVALLRAERVDCKVR